MNGYLKSTALLLAAVTVPLGARAPAADANKEGKHANRGPAVHQHHAPAQRAPMQQSPMQQAPVQQAPVQQAPMQHRALQNGMIGTSPSVERIRQNAPQATRPLHNGTQPGSPPVPPAAPSRSAFIPAPPTVNHRPAGGMHNFRLNQGSNALPGSVAPLHDRGTSFAAPARNGGRPTIEVPVRNPEPKGGANPIIAVPGTDGKKAIDLSKPSQARLPKAIDLSRKPVDLSKKPIDLPNRVGGKIDAGVPANRLPKLELPKSDKIAKPSIRVPDTKGAGGRPAPMPKMADGHQLHIPQPGPALADRLKKGDFHRLIDSNLGKKLDLKKQFDLHQHGDLSRRLNLGQQLSLNGGWQKRLCGPIDPMFGKHSFSACYCGPAYFPGFCWFPQWSPWVDWCWNFHCHPICDPRPLFCQPIYCEPCLPWIVWEYPIWTPMPIVMCGTWVDVPTVVVDAGYDVQLLASRFVDPGHPEQQLGPRYRVWFRNNSPVSIEQPFNVLAYASNDRVPQVGMPETGARIARMDAGQIQSVDLRLPFAASAMSRDLQGHKTPFEYLHVIVDSHREIPEAFEENNGSVLARGDILPVDPVIFAVDTEQLASGQVASGTVLHVAGEGFGPEPGQVLLHLGGLELQAEIVGWCDLGVQVRLPGLTLASAASAELIVVRGDQAASNPLTVNLAAGNVAQTNLFQTP